MDPMAHEVSLLRPLPRVYAGRMLPAIALDDPESPLITSYSYIALVILQETEFMPQH